MGPIVLTLRRYLYQLNGRVPRGDFFRGTVTIMAGTGLAQLITLGVAPILTRIYTPAQYGQFAVAAAILGILSTIACLTYEYAIPLPDSDVAAANLVALCLIITVGTSLLTASVLWLIGPWLLQQSGASDLGPFIALLGIGVFGGGVVLTFTSWALRAKTYSEIAANRLTQSGVLAASQVGLGLLGWGAPGLLIGLIASSLVGSFRLAHVAWSSYAESFRQVSRAGIRTVATRYRRFPILSAPSALINTLGLQAPLLLVVALYGAQVGGQLALAQRVIALPAIFLAGAIAQTFTAEAARRVRERPVELRRLFIRTSRSLALLAIIPIVAVAIAAKLFFVIIFGPEWDEAGTYVVILAPLFYLQFVTSPTGATLDVLERQDLHFIREVARLIIVSAAVVLAAALGLGSTAAIALLSFAGCITYLMYGATSWRAITTHHARSTAAQALSSPPADELRDPPQT